MTPSFWSFLKENMKKLHVDGLLESFVLESIDACETFIEMTKAMFMGLIRTCDQFIGDHAY